MTLRFQWPNSNVTLMVLRMQPGASHILGRSSHGAMPSLTLCHLPFSRNTEAYLIELDRDASEDGMLVTSWSVPRWCGSAVMHGYENPEAECGPTYFTC